MWSLDASGLHPRPHLSIDLAPLLQLITTLYFLTVTAISMGVHDSYNDFLQSEFQAVPLGIAETEMCLGAVLQVPGWGSARSSGDFRRRGTLASLCSANEHQEEIRTSLARVETLEPPFEEQKFHANIRGFWNVDSSSSWGLAVPNIPAIKAWLSSNSKVEYSLTNITTHTLKDDFLNDIFDNGKWEPNANELDNFYIINQIILASSIDVSLSNAGTGRAGARDAVDLDLPDPVKEGDCIYERSVQSRLRISGVKREADGEEIPFPIAFCTAQVRYAGERYNLACSEPHFLRRCVVF